MRTFAQLAGSDTIRPLDGKEAATVGKAFFAVALIVAAFAGGLATNGPALARLQSLAQGQPPRPPHPPSPSETDAGAPSAEIPSAAPTSLALGELSAPDLPPIRRPATVGKTDPSLVQAHRETPTIARVEPEAPAPLDPDSLDIAHASPTPTPTPPKLEEMSNSPGSSPSSSSSSPGWEGLRQRMKTLGVARYWVEGEPGGPARFRCLIPTAGGHAVSQHFEAEADDDFHAAEAALRRVALWKSTESP